MIHNNHEHEETCGFAGRCSPLSRLRFQDSFGKSIAVISNSAIIIRMKAKHAKTLRAIFTKPTLAGIVFADIEALVIALGGEVREGDGSRVVLEINGKRLYPHRPHPGKEAKRYQVEEFRALLESQGIVP